MSGIPDLRLDGLTALRFWENVERTDGCWEWQGATAAGYGRFRVDGRLQGAHRVAYALTYGAVPRSKVIRHTCDNRRCVYFGHLRMGTQADNVADMDEKGRRGRPIPYTRTPKPERAISPVCAAPRPPRRAPPEPGKRRPLQPLPPRDPNSFLTERDYADLRKRRKQRVLDG